MAEGDTSTATESPANASTSVTTTAATAAPKVPPPGPGQWSVNNPRGEVPSARCVPPPQGCTAIVLKYIKCIGPRVE
eukprot:CAMPEP_0206041210 /NCGR_PEP_ID=MMETSP1466-20131121/5845_1 /ASSEMBLY_ACC=CAM_ASM_001126 /TAXON_ID=44452 /ORGANISM="Pavlova gyrans, Strain CCMP608" /LENGTH=76 /DNA_ID=CAMNT_0053415903 /DNA_START=97 /DNA_END=327 /DNA_ORIENTATION=+